MVESNCHSGYFSLIEIMIGYGCITLFIGCISHPIIGFLPCFANIIVVCIFTRQEICVIGYTQGVIDGGFFVSPSMEIMLGQCFVDIIQLQISVCLTFDFLDRTTSFSVLQFYGSFAGHILMPIIPFCLPHRFPIQKTTYRLAPKANRVVRLHHR